MIIDISKVKIRKLGSDEIPLLVDYRIDYLTELQGIHDDFNLNEVRTGLTLFFEKAVTENRFFALVATEEDKILGFGGMIIKQIPGDFLKQTYFEGDILNMYTVPEARRQGISKMILDQLLYEASKIGICKLALHASKDGENLYREFGFTDPVYPYLELVIKPENFNH